MRLQIVVQFIDNNPRLHPCPVLLDVDFDDLVHILGHVNNNCLTHSLSCQTCTTAARQNRQAPLISNLDGFGYVLLVSWNNDADRLHLIQACIGAV